MARAKGADNVVVWRYDRLGRDSAEYIPLIKGLKRLGVDVVSVTQPTESIFMQQVIGIMAEEESRQLSIRVTASKQRRFHEGKWGTAPPFGYTSQKHPTGGSVLVPSKDAPLVTEMFQRYASGKHSLADLHDFLNEAGYVKSRYAVGYILKNRTYLGMVPHGKFSHSEFFPKPEATWAQGQHEPLIDPETFDLVQARLAGNANRRSGGPHPRFLFSGIIFCGDCGHKFTGRLTVNGQGKKYVQFNCSRKTAFGDCKSHSILEGRIRAAVLPPLQALLAQLKQEDIRAAVRKELTSQRDSLKLAAQQTRESLAETQSRLEARLSRIEDSYLDGDLSRDRYLTRRDEIMAQLEEVRAQLVARRHLALPDMEQIFALADALDGEPPDDQEWREIVEGIVDRVVIEGERSGSQGRAEQGTVKVVWKPSYEPLLNIVNSINE
jgi:site-specific DNA recombinase